LKLFCALALTRLCLKRAILQHSGGNDIWFKNGRTDFVSSWRYVYLRKRHGVWTARFETLGIAN